MRRVSTSIKAALGVAGMALTSSGAFAQAVGVPFMAEGPIRSITYNAATNTAVVSCAGLPVTVNASTLIKGGTRMLTVAELANTRAFASPGWNPVAPVATKRQGHVGSTCVADGVSPANGPYVATTLIVDPHQLVIAARTAALTLGTDGLAVGRVPVVYSTDDRLSLLRPMAGLFNADGTHAGDNDVRIGNFRSLQVDSVRNDLGFGVVRDSVPAGTEWAVSGYAGENGAMYAFDITVLDGRLTNDTPRPATSEVRCGPAGANQQIRILGGCVLPAGATSVALTIEGVNANGTFSPLATTTCTGPSPSVVIGNPQMGVVNFRGDVPAPAVGACHTKVRISGNFGGVTRYHFAPAH